MVVPDEDVYFMPCLDPVLKNLEAALRLIRTGDFKVTGTGLVATFCTERNNNVKLMYSALYVLVNYSEGFVWASCD